MSRATMASTWQERYFNYFYDRDRGWVDGTTEFHELCRSLAGNRRPRILEIGAGPDNNTSRFLATLGELHGLDPDPDVKTNASLTSAAVLDGDHFPYDDGAFDLCVSNYVAEHVADPRRHLDEVHRVLSPGGAYVFRTPNRWHYVSLVSRATPHWFHVLVANRLRNLPTDAHDPYPTCYRMNSVSDVERLAHATNFTVEQLRLVEKDPSYGRSSRLLFGVFVAYERVVNAGEFAANLRANIFAVLRRQ